MAAAIVIPVGLPSVAVGLYMQTLYPDIQPIMVLPTYLINEVHPLLGGLAMGGIILSLIGGIGGLTLGIGTMITRDMIVPLCRMTDDRKMLTVNKLTVLFVMLLACFIAILNRGSEVLFWTYISMALRGGGIGRGTWRARRRERGGGGGDGGRHGGGRGDDGSTPANRWG